MDIPRTIFTQEKANYWRFMSLVFDIGGDVLREMLSEYWKKAGSTLELFLGTTFTKCQTQILLNKDIITQNQYDLLYPANSVPPNIKLFDISLLFTLLRNLHPKLKTGDPVWTSPNDSDLSREADIRRVTDFRNRVVHSHTASMSDVDFAANWTSLETVLHRLVQNHPIETDIKQRIVALQTASHSLNIEPAIDRMTDCEELIRNAIEQEKSEPSPDLKIVHLVAFSGRVNLMKMLVENNDEYGVDIEQLTHDGKNVMHIACEAGHNDMFFYLFKEIPNLLHEKDNNGRFSWHWAAYGGNLHLMKFFCKMQHKFNIDLLVTDYNGQNVIFYAALGGQSTVFTFLKDNFPSLLTVTDDNGFTVGHYAAYGGEVEIMKMLLQVKEEIAFDLSARSDSGLSLLHTACLGGSLSMFESLSSQVNQNAFDQTDEEGKSVVHWAAAGGNVDIIKYLQRKNGGNLTSLTGSGQTILHEACAAGKEEMFEYILSVHPEMLNIKDDIGNTVAHWVAHGGNVNIMKKMKNLHESKKADLRITNDRGETIIHKACASGRKSMFDFVFGCVPQMLQGKDDQGYTLLHWAALGGSIEITKTVLEQVGNAEEIVDNLTNDGQNVLHLACLAGKEQMFNFLYNKYPKLIAGRDDAGNSIAHSTALGGNLQILKRVKGIYEKGKLDIYGVNGAGQTAMHITCMMGSRKCFDFLFETAPDLANKVDAEGGNVFHWIAYSGNIKLMKTLEKNISETSEIRIKDKTFYGQNVLHLACKAGRERMFKYILSLHKEMITETDNEGFTTAHWAAVGGNLSILTALKASNDLDLTQKSFKGLSILHMSCLDRTKLLYLNSHFRANTIKTQRTKRIKDMDSIENTEIDVLPTGARIDQLEQTALPEQPTCKGNVHVSKTRMTNTFKVIFHWYGQMLIEKDIYGRNVYHFMAMSGNKPLLEYLEKVVDEQRINLIENTDLGGLNALHFACLSGDNASFEYVLELHPEMLREYDERNFSVLHWTAYGGNVKIMEYLLKRFEDSDFRETTCTNRTIVDLSCESGQKAMFDMLVDRFPDLLNISNNLGLGPVHWAAYGGNLRILKYFSERLHEGNLNVFQPSQEGASILHMACISGRINVLEFIFTASAYIQSDMDDPLEKAQALIRTAISGNLGALKYMIDKYGCSVLDYTDEHGFSVFTYACMAGHKNVFDFLIKKNPILYMHVTI